MNDKITSYSWSPDRDEQQGSQGYSNGELGIQMGGESFVIDMGGDDQGIYQEQDGQRIKLDLERGDVIELQLAAYGLEQEMREPGGDPEISSRLEQHLAKTIQEALLPKTIGCNKDYDISDDPDGIKDGEISVTIGNHNFTVDLSGPDFGLYENGTKLDIPFNELYDVIQTGHDLKEQMTQRGGDIEKQAETEQDLANQIRATLFHERDGSTTPSR